MGTTAAHAQVSGGGATIGRPHDPVVLTGADLFPADDPAIADLAFYRWDGAGWTAIPFQVDERTAAGLYTPLGTDDEDGGTALLDDNDEIVFMGYDAGESSSCSDSNQLITGDHDRQAVTVTDPLNGETGTVYAVTGTAASADAYFNWDSAAQMVSGDYNSSYEATFGSVVTPAHISLENLVVNGSVDVLDRMKVRIAAEAQPQFIVCLPAIGITLDEQSATDFFPGAIDLNVFGPIRAVGGGQDNLSIAAYGSQLAISFALDPADIEAQIAASGTPICAGTVALNYARISFDGNDPAATGMTNYFDSNGNSATVDGAADGGIAGSTIPDWFQVSDDGTNGGFVVIVDNVEAGTGAISTYYVDDNSGGVVGDPAPYNTFADTGDLLSYGDVGLTVIGSGAAPLAFSLQTYIMEAGATGNVGADYLAYANNPLGAAVAAESCVATAVTPTSIPATNTPIPATDTPVPPTAEPTTPPTSEPTTPPTIPPTDEPTVEPTDPAPLAVETTMEREQIPPSSAGSNQLLYYILAGLGVLALFGIVVGVIRR